MSDTVVALEQRALECERKANYVNDAAARKRFLELAETWREMASDYAALSQKAAQSRAR